MVWEPKLRIVILEVGNEHVSHSGSTGDLRIGPSRVHSIEEPEIPEELRIALDALLDDLGFDDFLTTSD